MLLAAIIALCLVAGIVIAIDPFYHYHKPLPFLKAVLTEKEYQCIGSLRNFDYDAVIAGSSVAENYNNAWFDDRFDCTSIKAIRSYGATADLCYYLEEAFNTHDIRYVFYNLDPAALKSDTEISFESTGCPMYLYDRNPFNDTQYLFNKDVLLERIPYNIVKSLTGDYDEGESYNWGNHKEFNLDMILGLYIRHADIKPMNDCHSYDDLLEDNISLIENLISSHPDTKFYIFMPPYSMMWWDNIYREGDTDFYIYGIGKAMERLTSFDNVSFSFFMNDRDVICNIEENYMDVVHFSPDINYYICESLLNGNSEVQPENIHDVMEDMRALASEITDTLVIPYEDRLIEY